MLKKTMERIYNKQHSKIEKAKKKVKELEAAIQALESDHDFRSAKAYLAEDTRRQAVAPLRMVA